MKAWCSLTLLAVVAVGCGDNSQIAGDGGPINSQGCGLANVDSLCGTPCTGQADCGNSLFCGTNQRCSAECVVGSAETCVAGQICGLYGHCIPGSSGNSDGGDNQDGDSCPRINVNLAPIIPNVFLLLDQSGSMNMQDFPIPNSNPVVKESRWKALKTALTDPTTGVLPQLDGKVRFAAALYTGVTGSCPELIETPPLDNSAAAVKTLLTTNNPADDTPTGAALDSTVSRLMSTQIFGGDPAPTVIVLATDGDPDLCGDSNGDGKPDAVRAAHDAFVAHFPVYMLSVSTSPSTDHMHAMANAGVGLEVGGPTNADYYVASSSQDLIDAFGKIIKGVRNCKIHLNGTLAESGAATGDVELNGTPLQYNDPNGWKWIDSTTIELEGDACHTFEDSPTVDLSATFDCGTVIL